MDEVVARSVSGAKSERTALKEWAVLAEAMGQGEIIAMIRKGGIREQRAGFSVRHDRFVLYPTYFHENASEFAPRFRSSLPAGAASRPAEGTIAIDLVADVAAVWRVTVLEPLRSIGDEHGLDWTAVESRFHYRDRPGVHVVAVRVARLGRRAELAEARRYGGCVSWVELDADVELGGSRPVVADDEFASRLVRLRDALGAPETS